MKMKAIVAEKYGSPDILQLREVDIPTPGDDEVLVKIHAAAVNAYDWHLLRADPVLVRLMGGGFWRPKQQILGADLAGTVTAVGKNISGLQPGDAVFGDIAGHGSGSFAEYAPAPEKALALKPDGLSFAEAAGVPMAAVTALQGLRDAGQIQAGQQVLIQGASGGVGTFAVQLARHFGAEVTAVCSTGKMEKTRALGADHVIDYTKEDFTRGDRQYDLILGVNGYQPLWAYKRALRPGGRYIMAGGSNAQIFQAMLLAPFLARSGDSHLGNVTAKMNRADLAFLAGLLAEGTLVTVIDRSYPLAEVADAIRYLEAGHAAGKVIITVVA